MFKLLHLTCGYQSRFLLKDINLEFKKNEFTGLVGPNGSGKTTLLKALTKVLTPVSGMVQFEGKDLRAITPRELACKVAVVSQAYTLDINMKAEELVLLGRLPHRSTFQLFETRTDEARAHEAMVLTDTFKFKDRFLSELSGGERQLVFIASALAQEPQFLLLDEPTNHLDIAHQVQVLDLLKRLHQERGLSVILVLHDLNLASEYCDRLVLLNAGTVYKTGTPQEVLDYQTIEAVYGTPVIVHPNPFSAKPVILIVSEAEQKKKRQ
jgi:iron complex transport system ATP-binding protein